MKHFRLALLSIALVATSLIVTTGVFSQGQEFHHGIPVNGMQNDGTPAPFVGQDSKITVVKIHEDGDEEMAFELDVSGHFEYIHVRESVAPGWVPWSPDPQKQFETLEINDVLDAPSTQLLFAVFAAGGFEEFPSTFPGGNSNKTGFDTWVTVDADGSSKTVFSPTDGFVPESFAVIQNTLDRLVSFIENRQLVAMDAYDEFGTYIGGISVRMNGIATVRTTNRSHDEIALDSVSTYTRVLSEKRMEAIHEILDSTNFFALPTCNDMEAQAGVENPNAFSMTYRSHGNEKTVYFASGSEVGNYYHVLAGWLLRVIQ